MDANEHREWNEAMARRYDPETFISKSGFIIRWIEQLRLQKTRELLDCDKMHKVLDVGCGSGHLLQLLDSNDLTGIDLSPTLLSQAQHKLSQKPHIKLLLASGENLPFPSDTFDRVVCAEVLEHCLNPERVLSEIVRVAKATAKVLITLPNERLINTCKKLIILLNLKKVVAGRYHMSSNMLDEWHINDINDTQLFKMSKNKLTHLKSVSIPIRPFSIHRIHVFTAEK